MSYEIPLLRHTFEAAADLSGAADLTAGSHPQSGAKGGGNYIAVSLNNAGNLVVATAAASCLGILQNRPKLGEAGAVESAGVSFARIGATIANAGTVLEVGSDGVLVAATTGVPVARLLEPASGAGAICAVQVFPGSTIAIGA